MMDEDEADRPSPQERWSGRLGLLIGAIALLAWLCMLWLMFGDVL